MLRGWLERVLVPGVAFTFDEQGKVRPALSNVRRIVGVSTYGAPWTYVKLLQRRRPADADAGAADELRAAHADDVARPVLDGHRTATPSGAAFLDRVEHSMAHLHQGRRVTRERTLVVHCHPDPASFTARRRATGPSRRCAARGDEVRVTDLYAAGFDPVFSAEERDRHLEPGPDPSVADHAADLQWCEQLVLVYPTWWSGQPAMLKGWIDRVWVARRRVRPAAGVEPHPRPAAQRPADRRHHDPRLVEVRQRARGRGRQAHGHPYAAGRVPPAGPHDVDRDVRHRHGRRAERAPGVPRQDRARACGEPAPACAACARSSPRSVSSSTRDRSGRRSCSPRSTTPCARTSTSGGCRASGRSSSRRPTRSTWEVGTQLAVTRRPVEAMPLDGSRLFADGLSSWLIRRVSRRRRVGRVRPAGRLRARPRRARRDDGRDVVQRHPSGSVRIVGDFGVLRWEGLTWHREPPIGAWIDAVTACGRPRRPRGARDRCSSSPSTTSAPAASARCSCTGPTTTPAPTIELRLPTPPPLDVRRPSDLAPLRHALAPDRRRRRVRRRRRPARARRAAGAERRRPRRSSRACAACATRRAAATASTTRRRRSSSSARTAP